MQEQHDLESVDGNSAHVKSGRSLWPVEAANLTSGGVGGSLEGDEVDINRIYSPWSRWSRCSRRCKQVSPDLSRKVSKYIYLIILQRRERVCSVPAVCGAAVVRMERGCHSDRCRGRDFSIVRWGQTVLVVRIVTPVTIHRRRQKLGRKTKQQMRRHRQFYSRWSRWSPCTQLCQTTRTKVGSGV